MPLDFEDIRDLREEWEFTLDRDAYRAQIASYVEDLAVGDVGRAELLAGLCECLLADEDAPQGELERAIVLAHEAIADGGEVTSDPRVNLVDALDRLGREDEMVTLVRSCLRDRTLVTHTETSTPTSEKCSSCAGTFSSPSEPSPSGSRTSILRSMSPTSMRTCASAGATGYVARSTPGSTHSIALSRISSPRQRRRSGSEPRSKAQQRAHSTTRRSETPTQAAMRSMSCGSVVTTTSVRRTAPSTTERSTASS
jgi:hypothetical protein